MGTWCRSARFLLLLLSAASNVPTIGSVAPAAAAFQPTDVASQQRNERRPRSLALLSRRSSSNNDDDFETDFVPCLIQLDQVSLQFPVTLARRLFSSVPRREFALHNVSCRFGGRKDGEIVLVQGASSSGKSALFHVVIGTQPATKGTVTIVTTTHHHHHNGTAAATPVMLVDKPPFDDTNTVQSLLERQAAKTIQPAVSQLPNNINNIITTHVLREVCRRTNLDMAAWADMTPAQCSPSENYRLQLTLACLQSSLPGLSVQRTSASRGELDRILLPAPILLMDEWMDLETRASSAKVEDAIRQLVQQTGAIVLCATHKPQLWKVFTMQTRPMSQLTMSRGEILSLQQQ